MSPSPTNLSRVDGACDMRLWIVCPCYRDVESFVDTPRRILENLRKRANGRPI